MKITVSRTELQREMQVLRAAAGSRVIPILSGVKLSCVGDRLEMLATDLDLTVMTSIHADADGEGVVVVEYGTMSDLLPKLGSESVTLETEDGAVVLECGGFRSRLSTLDSESYPVVPAVFPENGCAVPLDTLKAMIARTSFVSTRNDPKYQLGGVLMTMSGDQVGLVATDGVRLVVTSTGAEGDSPPFDQETIPRRRLLEIGRLEGESVEISADESFLYFRAGDRMLVSRRVETRFPQYERLMKVTGEPVTVDSSLLLAALRRVVVLSHETSHKVSVAVSNDSIAVVAENSTGSASETVAASCEAEVSFLTSGQSLVEALSVVDAGEVTMHVAKDRVMMSDESDGVSWYYMQAHMRG